MKETTTTRGFKLIEFVDYYDIDCSLQKSSLINENAIWFGCDDANPKYFSKNGWKDVEMPDEYIANTRMHLTVEQVKKLLPHLIKFVETGDL